MDPNNDLENINPRKEHPCGWLVKKYYLHHWRGIWFILFPAIFLPLPICYNTKAAKCLYTIIVMICYWVSNVIPYAVTSMIPIFAFPGFNILDSDKIGTRYFSDSVVVLISSIIVASGFEYSNLHKRITLTLLMKVGYKVKTLHAILMLVTFVMSYGIPNTAATALMVPIVGEVLRHLSEQNVIDLYKAMDEENLTPGETFNEQPSKVAIGFYLGVAFTATISGCGNLIGSGALTSAESIYSSHYPDQIMYNIKYMSFATPMVLLLTVSTVLFLQIVYLRLFRTPEDRGEIGRKTTFILQEKESIGPFNWHQFIIVVLFVVLIFLFITRKPEIFPGWAHLTNSPKLVRNSLPSTAVAILYFIIPADWNFLRFCYKSSEPLPHKETPSLIKWAFVGKKMPWGLVFLIGASYSLHGALEASGLSASIAKWAALKGLPKEVTILVAITMCTVLTQVCVNTLSMNIVIPIGLYAAKELNVHPLYISLAIILSANMAFLLPAGTPPNAIVSGWAHIKTKDMFLAGLFPLLVSIILNFGSVALWSQVVYGDLNGYPPNWKENFTASSF